MRPGLPDPLIAPLGGRWAMGAPVVGIAWFGLRDVVAFGLADGTLAIARARWHGAARVQPRESGGVELVPATAPPPPVMRVGIHAGPCLTVAADGFGGVLSGGLDGRLACVDEEARVETLASFPGARIDCAAAGRNGVRACAVGRQVHRFGSARAVLDLPGPVTAMAFDPTGRDLAIGHQDGVTLWPAGAAAPRLLPRTGAHRTLAWSSSGQHLVSGLEEKAAHGWHLPDGTEAAIGDYPNPPLSLCFSSVGCFFATSGGRRVVCWRLGETGRIASRSECGVGSTVAVTQVACHPVRQLIAAGYENGAVLLCQPDSADILFVRSAGGGAVSALAWSADGAFLALGSAGGEIGVVAFPERLFRAAPAAVAPAQRNPER